MSRGMRSFLRGKTFCLFRPQVTFNRQTNGVRRNWVGLFFLISTINECTGISLLHFGRDFRRHKCVLERLLLDTKIAIIFFQDRCPLNTLALFRHFRVVYNRILCGIRRRGFLHRLRPILENHQDSNGEIGLKNNWNEGDGLTESI